MGMTFTIGTSVFGAISMASGRFALNIKVGAPRYKKDRFHVPGVDGNYIIRHGMSGRSIVCSMAYVGTYADVLTLIEDDRESWGNASVTIVDDKGSSYPGCNFENFARSSPVGFNDATNNWVIVEAEAMFEEDFLVNMAP